MASPAGPVQGVSGHDAVTFFDTVSMRLIVPSAGRATKTLPFPSATAELGRPLRGIVSITSLVVLSMTVALWPRELKTNTDLVVASKTMVLGIGTVGNEGSSLRVERSKARTKPAVPSVTSVT